jgi:hypothetical protein
MISLVAIDNFKALSGLTFRDNKLTILTGANSVGKSTFIQSLLMARIAAVSDQKRPIIVPLNGPFDLSLGEFSDILTHDPNSGSEIVFKFEIDDKYIDLHFFQKGSRRVTRARNMVGEPRSLSVPNRQAHLLILVQNETVRAILIWHPRYRESLYKLAPAAKVLPTC